MLISLNQDTESNSWSDIWTFWRLYYGCAVGIYVRCCKTNCDVITQSYHSFQARSTNNNSSSNLTKDHRINLVAALKDCHLHLATMFPPRVLCSEVLASFLCLTSPSSCQQEYKRRSRDIETETEEDLLLFPSLDASSGSLSSSISLSDKSVSTDNNVEEFFGDAPFAGQFVRRLACSMSVKM